MRQGRTYRLARSLAPLALVLACAAPHAERPPSGAPAATPDAESMALATYYQKVEDSLVSQGLLRTDGGGPDTPFTSTTLAQDFVRIALFNEYTSDGVALRPLNSISSLRRWEQPIRMSVEFGPSIPQAQRAADRQAIAGFADRLSGLTGVRITQTDRDPNFYVLELNENERRGAEERLRSLAPGIDESSVQTIVNLPRSQFCMVIAFSGGTDPGYARAIAIIRGEHPDLLRLSCIHEELAQGMGLANDSPSARPSIFNDDEEFGLLTTHDELLLRMLYDPRLRSGMQAAAAAPIARRIAAELLPAPAMTTKE